jgi:YgiT-type zinc finger domain-containing protein
MCLSNEKIKTKTTFTVDYNGCIIVVKNVPCLECPVCGETIFTDEVSSRLEKLVESAKKIMQEVSVIDYLKVA